ncbi:MAG: UDP-3-O-(3-hydroxymyristoyl)glucosamine N-acyltransferase [Betaproteobacteria bacterium]|nr:UDP-3-O-(3-hydroxymyristoyl)glucosamine N-acyltransferase [Betaproteobacteria bacterium]
MSKRKSFRLGELVKRLGGELIGDADVRIHQVATLESAGPTDITFLTQSRFLPQLGRTQAGAVILGPETRDASGLPRIISANPYAYFASVSALLNPPAVVEPGIHESAVVDKSARVAASASIGACAVIGRHARVADHAIVGPGCFIGEGASIGTGSRLHANVAVYHDCRIGARCIVHAGAVVGSDGFGIAKEDGVWKKIPQIGRALIGDDVEIGANTTIDRGALDDTVIEDGVKLDNQIHIAHNVRIGAHTAIAACVGIAGSAKIGRNCALGGASMIYGHITLADNVNVSAGTLIMKSLEKPGTYTGVYPFSSHQRWLRNAAHLRQLDDLAKRVRELEGRLGKTGRGKT